MIRENIAKLKGNWIVVITINMFLISIWYFGHQILSDIYFQKTFFSLEQDLKQEEDLEKIVHNKKYQRIFKDQEGFLRNAYVLDSLLRQDDYSQLEKVMKEIPPPLVPEFGKFKEKFIIENLEKKDTKALEEKKILRAILRDLIKEKVVRQ